MKSRFAVAALMVLCCAAGAAAQESFDWLAGRWSEQVRAQTSNRSARTLQIEITGDTLRVSELGEDGDEKRCRLDGKETRSTKVESKSTVE